MLTGLVLLGTLLTVPGRVCAGDVCQELALEGGAARFAVAPADVARPLTWVAADGTKAVLGSVPANAESAEVTMAAGVVLVQAVAGEDDPLPPLTVSVSSRDNEARWSLSVRPDKDSHELRLFVSPGTYDVTLEAEERRVTPDEKVDVVVRADSPIEPPVWRLVPQLAGLVRRTDGEPIEDAEIEDEEGELLAVSGFDGRFLVDEPAPDGSRLFVVRAAGYGSQYVYVPPEAGEVGTIELHEGATVQLVVNHPTALEPLPIVVRVRPDARDAPGVLFRGEGTTGTRMQITDLPPGEHLLYVDGPEPLQRYARKLEITGPDIEIAVSLEPVTLEGSVRLGARPLTDGNVELRGEPQWEASVDVDEEGRFGGEMWDRGDLFGFVTADGIDRPYFFGDKGPSGDPRIVDLRIPATLLEGRVESEGKPVPGAQINIATRNGDVQGSTGAKSDENGRFEVRGLSEGSHAVTVTADGYLRAQADFETSVADESHDLVIELQRGREVRLVVTGRQEAPVGGAQIWVGVRADGMSSERMVFASADGRATVTTDPLSTTQIVVSDPYGGGFATALLAPDGPDERRVAIVPGSGELSLRAVDGDGAPVPGVGILVRYDGLVIPPLVLANILGPRRVSAVTAADGTLRLPALPAGRYELFAYGPVVRLPDLLASHTTIAPTADVFVDGRSVVTVTVRIEPSPGGERQLVATAGGPQVK